MATRFDPFQSPSEAIQAVEALESYVQGCGLDVGLLELIKTRASQINGCAFCIDMHTRAARQHGETEQRLSCLDAWQETDIFSGREKAALAWTEAVTLVSQSHVPDAVYAEASNHFSADELVKLTVAIGLINTWNRIAIGFRVDVAAT